MFSQLNLQLKPTPVIGVVIAVPIMASVLLISSLALPAIIATLIISLILGVLYYYLTLLSLLSRPGSIIRIQISQHSITLYDTSGREMPVRLKKNSLVSRWFCILEFEALLPEKLLPKKQMFFTLKRRWSIILCDYNVTDVDHLRRLRVLLNYGDFSQIDNQLNVISPQ